MDESENTFHDELEKIYNEFFPSGATDNFCLYHYTDYNGLIGILQSRQIWLTDYRYLNDSSEIEYSFKKISAALLKYLHILNHMDRHHLGLFQFILQKETFHKSYDFFVFSTCKRKNYLPAWRWYANNGTGFSIAFNFKSNNVLPPIFHTPPAFGLIDLGKVHYASDVLDEYIPLIFNKANELINANNSRFVIGAVLSYILMIIPRFKHYSFKEESEYRIFALKEPHKSIPDEMKHWSPSNSSAEPFVSSIPRMKIDINKINIQYIITGPKCNHEHAKHELNKLLKVYGYQDIPILKSLIPYR